MNVITREIGAPLTLITAHQNSILAHIHHSLAMQDFLCSYHPWAIIYRYNQNLALSSDCVHFVVI
jgi:hypothetical protein